jgi:hypothetical protein
MIDQKSKQIDKIITLRFLSLSETIDKNIPVKVKITMKIGPATTYKKHNKYLNFIN